MSEQRVQRRLAAVLAADIVGYSRLMEADEAGTLARVKALRAEVLDPLIVAFGGRVVKITGDGTLAEFASAVDVVRCAVAFQGEVAARDGDLPVERRIAFRVGINLGDVIVDGEDIYGDGVNLAARLEALADPGGVLVSGAVRDQVQDKVDFAFEDLGDRAVKNMARPVRVFRVAVEGAAAHRARPAPPPPERPSIAVLPFANLSGDPEQEYFSDGISEDLITDLSKLSGLFVIARNSAFTYKGRAVRVDEVCRELGVRHVLEGSVRRAGKRVRVTAQLIDGASGGHLWAERYDRDLSDVFAVQDELTREIVEALRIRLTPEESARLGAAETGNVEAYDLVLRATEQHNRVTAEANAEARLLLERALTLVPDYARAHALLGSNDLQVAINGWVEDPTEAFGRAYASACRAVALDAGLALAHQSKSYVALWRRQFDEATAEIDAAIRLEPNDAVSHTYRALILAFTGSSEQAIGAAETALRHDPHRSLSLFAAGLAHYEAGRYDGAVALLRRVSVLRPDFMPMFMYLAAALAQIGRIDEARDAVSRGLRINPRISQSVARAILPYRDPAALERFVATLAGAGLPA